MKQTFSILFLFLSIFSFAQKNIINYSVSDGLAQNQVMCIFQDSKGYLWIGTKGGLSKFDGISFKNYTFKDGLISSFICNILEDSEKNIWIITYKGVCKYTNGKFISYNPNINLNIQIGNLRSFIDNDNNIVFVDNKKKRYNLIKFNTTSKKYIILPEFTNIPHLKIHYSKRTNQMFLLFKDSLQVFTDKNYHKTIYVGIYSSLETNDTLFFLTKEKGTFYWQNNNLHFYSDKYLVNKTKNGRIYSTSCKYNAEKFVLCDKFDKFVLKLNAKELYIRQIYTDKELNLWIATESGLLKLCAFYFFPKIEGFLQNVWSIVEDINNNIWFASYTSQSLISINNNFEVTENENSGAYYMGAIKTKNNIMYIPASGFILKYDGKSFVKIDCETQLFLYEDTIDKCIYVGATSGLNKLTYKDEINLVSDKYIKEKLGTIIGLIRNRKNQLWYATRKGIGYFTETDTIFISNDSIPLIGATSLYCDYNDNLWIGCENGLFFYDYNKFIRIDHPELQTTINSVAKMDENHIVYGGLRGIGILNLELFYKQLSDSLNISNNNYSYIDYYDKSQGFMGEEVGQNGIFKDSKGRIWIPTNTSVVMFDPKDLRKNTKPPFTHITNFQTSIDKVNWTNSADTINKFPHNENNIRINYTGICHTAPEMVKYKYRLIGSNDTWSHETKEMYVTFMNLPPGKYTFQLLACNNNNIWNEHPTEHSFEIKPAWYQTLLFIIAGSISLILIITFTIVVIVTQVYKRREQKRKFIDLQFNSLTNQLYPHFLFNAIANIASVVVKNPTAYKISTKLTALIREVQIDREKLHKTIKEELDFTEKYLQIQQFRFSKRFTYEIIIGEQIDLNQKIPQMLIQTFVENAIKHGLERLKKDGKLLIKLFKENNTTYIIIKDNGIGIDAVKKLKTTGTGRCLRIINEIKDLHNQNFKTKINFKIEDLNKINETGTQVEISIK